MESAVVLHGNAYANDLFRHKDKQCVPKSDLYRYILNGLTDDKADSILCMH